MCFPSTAHAILGIKWLSRTAGFAEGSVEANQVSGQADIDRCGGHCSHKHRRLDKGHEHLRLAIIQPDLIFLAEVDRGQLEVMVTDDLLG